MDELETELDNLRLALEWSMGEEGNIGAADGLLLATNLDRFWSNRCYFREGRTWIERGLAGVNTADPHLAPTLAKAYFTAGMLAEEQFDNLDKLLSKNNIVKNTVNEKDIATGKVIKIDFVNYHILIDHSEPNILKFIEDQGKCVKISDNTYKITFGNMSEFDKIMDSSGIKKEFITEADDEYVIIKALIINYEINIDASQTAAVSFLKDTEKCVPINDSVFKLSRDSFNKFKELINDPAIEVKVLNETNNQDVIIKVNNI
jgi:hypothetical protein